MLMPHLAAERSIPSSDRPGGITAKRWIALLVRGLTIVAILFVSGFLVLQARNLWQEWRMLQGEVRESQARAIVGYPNITPIASSAEAPTDWFRDDGTKVLMWSKWEPGVGHHWFHFASGEVNRDRISRPSRLFISRAIDYPLVETKGGEVWQRIPSESVVVGYTLEGQKCYYPVAVLVKFEVINDLVEGHPYLIVMNAFTAARDGYSIFDASLDGRRVTMSTTGYFQDGKPLVVDRGTESLWC
jgi:hypothetical protein